jgi:ABC-2 type transport system ATP-binding protein
MMVREQLMFFAELHGLDAARAAANADALIERLGLAERANEKLEKLSLGNQQRAQIAAALVHDPTALILDEPFSGLDPMAVDLVLDVLREFAADGAPILFSSHQLDVVERITDDLIVIADGQIRAAGETKALREEYAGSRYRLVVPGALKAADAVRQVPGVSALVVKGAGEDATSTLSSEIEFDAAPEVAQKALKDALAVGPVDGFGRVYPPLSEVFREVVA